MSEMVAASRALARRFGGARAGDDPLASLLHATTGITASAAPAATVLERALEVTCRHLGWPVAIARTIEGTHLIAAAAWPPQEAAAPASPAAEEARRGRAAIDPQAGVVAVPIGLAGTVRGVLELRPPDAGAITEEVVGALVDVGVQLAWVLEREELLDRLAESDEAQALFISRAAHQLRGPLATLGVSATTLATRIDRLTPIQRDQLGEAVEQQVGLLADLLGRLVELTELEAGRVAVQVRPVDVGSLVRAVVADSALPFLTLIPGDEGVVAVADETAVHAILMTLLANVADHAGHADHTAELEVGADADTVRITVRDDGPGIDPAVRPTLFHPFARSRRGSGFGLGLATSRRLARACGGDLVADAERDVGAAFTLTLPRAR